MRIVMPIAVVAVLATAQVAIAQPETPNSSQTPAAEDEPSEVEPAVVEAPRPEPDPEVCRRVAPTGSRIAVKVCKPKSEWVAKSMNAPKFAEPQYSDGQDALAAPKAQEN